MLRHEDDCDKVIYEGGLCTCGLSRGSVRTDEQRDAQDEAATAAGEAMELES